MKKLILLFVFTAAVCSIFAADPPKKDISSILLLDNTFTLNKTLAGENGIKGTVADFNGDGYDDFILTGLYVADDATTKGFFYVYLGQTSGVPVLAYADEDFKVVGNGAIDCAKISDGEFLVALQGGSVGNWTNPFKGQVYKLKVTGSSVTFNYVTDLDFGGGRNSILLLDMNNDSKPDIFQGGWTAVNTWDAQTHIYINDGTNEWFDLEGYEAGNEPIRKANNTFVVKGDLNIDSKNDLVQPVQGIGLFAYFNNGDKTFTEKLVTPFALSDRADNRNIRGEEDGSQAELIDFNGDGLLDIILAGTNDNGSRWEYVLFLFKNNGDSTFTEISPTNKSGEPATFIGGQRGDIATADFDCDGKMDFIIGVENQNDANQWGCRTYFMNGNGNGGFDQWDITYDATTNPQGVPAMSRRANFGRYLVGDFNGDGKKDLVAAGANYYAKDAGLRLYFNVSTSTGIKQLNENSNIRIFNYGTKVIVNGAETKSTIEVFNASGQKVYTGNIDSQNYIFNLKAKAGLYIIKVNGYVQKILLN
jgi:hypothetical protein